MLRIAGRILLAGAGVVVWSLTPRVASPGGQAATFAAAVGLLLLALRPWYGLALFVAGILALGVDPDGLETPSAWSLAFLVLASAGPLLLLRRRAPFLAGILASLPFWAMSNAVPGLVLPAIALAAGGFLVATVAPLVSRRRRTGETPRPELANGPLVPVEERELRATRGLGPLRAMTALCALGVPVGVVLWLAGRPGAGGITAYLGALLAACFGLPLWLSLRLSYRVDARGVHARVVPGTRTIPWTELSSLSLREVQMLNVGYRVVYLVVRAPTVEIAVPLSLPGGREFAAAVERAAGLTLPEYELPLRS